MTLEIFIDVAPMKCLPQMPGQMHRDGLQGRRNRLIDLRFNLLNGYSLIELEYFIFKIHSPEIRESKRWRSLRQLNIFLRKSVSWFAMPWYTARRMAASMVCVSELSFLAEINGSPATWKTNVRWPSWWSCRISSRSSINYSNRPMPIANSYSSLLIPG